MNDDSFSSTAALFLMPSFFFLFCLCFSAIREVFVFFKKKSYKNEGINLVCLPPLPKMVVSPSVSPVFHCSLKA